MRDILIALSLDVDPDSNKPAPGRHDCVSSEFEGRVSLTAVRSGLQAFSELLANLGLPATIFWEARTMNVLASTAPDTVSALTGDEMFEHAFHGWRHEDFIGHRSRLPISDEEKTRRIKQGTNLVAAISGKRPLGFRAPYCRIDEPTLKILAGLGYNYDASMSVDASDAKRIESLGKAFPCTGAAGCGITELPMLKWHDGAGRPISGYLWQLLEGRRPPEDYTRMIAEIAEKHPGRLIQIAAHPWHLAVSGDGRRKLDVRKSAEKARKLLETLKKDPKIRFAKLSRFSCGADSQPGQEGIWNEE